MKRVKLHRLAFVFAFLLAEYAQLSLASDVVKPPVRSNAPLSFESYATIVAPLKAQPRLIFTTSLAKKYKTVITSEAAKPVNFAGHYRVATWGCGTDCRGFAIINKKTGVVYTLPGLVDIAGVTGNEEDRLVYKADSRLLIITGVQNDVLEGKFFYVWEKEKLRLLARHPIETHGAEINR